MSVYVVAQVEITDPDRYQHYVDGFRRTFHAFRGEVLAVDGAPAILEGDWPSIRSVIIRFDDEAEALRWYHSPEYQAAAAHRFVSARTNLALIRGIS